jgi:hypothetical protein
MKPAIIGTVDLQAPSDYLIRAALDGVNHVASEMERKWGVGRLRLLVSDLLRAKFDAQRDKLDAAVASNLVQHVQVHAEGMRRAWQALDRAATEAHHPPLSPEIWECRLPTSGEVVAVVRTDAEASLVCREMRVFTLDEVGKAIEALGEAVLEAKRMFPGATVTAVRSTKPPMDWEKGDDIPF